MIDSKEILKALVSVVIEKTLIDMGEPVYDKVADSLYEKYYYYITDCFKQPAYLKAVLKELDGESYNKIINSIRRELGEFTNNKEIEAFLQVLLQ